MPSEPLSIILAPNQKDGHNVVREELVYPPFLFCLDLKQTYLMLSQMRPASSFKARLRIFRKDGPRYTNLPWNQDAEDMAWELREGWPDDDDSFIRRGQRLEDPQTEDEESLIYFRFADIKLTATGIFDLDITVITPDGLPLAFLKTGNLECVTGRQPRKHPNPEQLDRAKDIFERLPELPDLRYSLFG